jgi:hypothetical protein
VFAQLAKALAQVVVNEIVTEIGEAVAAVALRLIERTRTKVIRQDDEITVELNSDAILQLVVEVIATIIRRVVTHPRVTAFLRQIPESVRVFFRAFVVGIRQALVESITTQLFNDTWRVYSEGRAA